MQMTKSIIQYKNNNELKKKEINKNICVIFIKIFPYVAYTKLHFLCK